MNSTFGPLEEDTVTVLGIGTDIHHQTVGKPVVDVEAGRRIKTIIDRRISTLEGNRMLGITPVNFYGAVTGILSTKSQRAKSM